MHELYLGWRGVGGEVRRCEVCGGGGGARI